MTRRLTAFGREWEVETTGTGHGVGSGLVLPAISHFGVVFRPLTGEPQRSIRGWIGRPNLADVSDNDLQVSLNQAIWEAGDHESIQESV